MRHSDQPRPMTDKRQTREERAMARWHKAAPGYWMSLYLDLVRESEGWRLYLYCDSHPLREWPFKTPKAALEWIDTPYMLRAPAGANPYCIIRGREHSAHRCAGHAPGTRRCRDRPSARRRPHRAIQGCQA
jgi:hypothetical protein